jgi:TPR repeat protein
MKTIKTFFNKLVSRVLTRGWKNNPSTDSSPHKMNENKSEFKEELRKYLGHIETKSLNKDYHLAMNLLYKRDEIVHKEGDPETEKEKAEKEVNKKLEVETQRIKSNFFNEYSLKILENTNSKHLVNIACKSFVGDTDIPRDPQRSFIILQMAKAQSESKEDIKDVQFYMDYFRKNASTDEKEMNDACKNIFHNESHIKAKYVTSRDLFNIITYNSYQVAQTSSLSKAEKDFMYEKIYNIMEQSSEKGIYEAFFFLGVMNLNGYYTKVNHKKAFYYFCIAASYSHALAYYELYKMLKENQIKIYSENEKEIKMKAMFDYLKYSAEEGYVEAMYELGNQYLYGGLRHKNYLKALSWHRQACRNGYILSYEPCGDILYNGGYGVNQNKALSLIMYYCGYSKGITEIKNKIVRVKEELQAQGEPLPEMVLI